MLKLKKIAITGGVASGKTSVCRFFQELGAFTVNADSVVHELLKSDIDVKRKVIQEFGSEILENGTISRKALAAKVFANSKLLKKLEDLVHPAALLAIEKLYRTACKAESFNAFVVEIPLLFEICGEPFYDYVFAVLADEAIARLRFEKAGFTREDYDRRMKRQLSPTHKAAQSHYTIMNNGSLQDLKTEVSQIHKMITKQP